MISLSFLELYGNLCSSDLRMTVEKDLRESLAPVPRPPLWALARFRRLSARAPDGMRSGLEFEANRVTKMDSLRSELTSARVQIQ